MFNKRSFTLVELLVAMAIIAVLISLSVFGINIVQQTARDTQRRAVLRDLDIALNGLRTSGASGFTTGSFSADSITFNGTGVGSQVVQLNGPTKRPTTDNIIGSQAVISNTTNSETDYCAGFSGVNYVIGLLLESGTVIYVNNTGSVYPTAWSTNTLAPTSGSGPSCLDENL